MVIMTSAQVVETSVNVITNSPSKDYTHPDDDTSYTSYNDTMETIFLASIQFCQGKEIKDNFNWKKKKIKGKE